MKTWEEFKNELGCPACRADETSLDYDGSEREDHEYFDRPVYCMACGLEFTIFYKLAGYEYVDIEGELVVVGK